MRIFVSIVSLLFCGNLFALVAEVPAKEQILRIGNGVEPKELDPTLVTGAPEGHIVDSLFEGLTNIEAYSPDPVPGVAESWQISADGLTYKFLIRKNAKWSDGKELNAEDFVYSWTRALDPKTASEYAYQLYSIKNGEAFNTGKLKDPKQLGIKAVDKFHLEVTLERPTPYFLQLTSFQTLYPTPKHIIEKYPGSTWTLENHMVSNGPFKLAESKLHQHIKLLANEFYWDKGAVRLKEIYIYPIDNKDTEEMNFLSGKLHMTSTVPSLHIPKYEAAAKNPKTYNPFRVQPLYATYYYRFNVTHKPLNDARVRRALAITIDRKQIVDDVIHGGKIAAASFVPPNASYDFPGNLPLRVTDAVRQEARTLLAQAGYPEGKGMPKFDILYDTDDDNKRIAVAIQQMWHKTLGIEVGLFKQEWKVYLDSISKQSFDIARSRWIGDYLDPNTFMGLHITNGGNNNTGWSNKNYDDYIRKASETMNPAERIGYFKKAEEILIKEVPIAPIFFYTTTNLVAQSMKNYNPKTKEFTEWKSDMLDRWLFKYCVLMEGSGK